MSIFSRTNICCTVFHFDAINKTRSILYPFLLLSVNKTVFIKRKFHWTKLKNENKNIYINKKHIYRHITGFFCGVLVFSKCLDIIEQSPPSLKNDSYKTISLTLSKLSDHKSYIEININNCTCIKHQLNFR